MLELDPLSIVKSIATSEILISGRLVDASNATLFGKVISDTGVHEIPIIYKPIAGERPLWDFPDGDLASREVAAYQINKFLGFNIVPFTTLRDGPYGIGAVQQWIEIDEAFDLITFSQTDDFRLREIALLTRLLTILIAKLVIYLWMLIINCLESTMAFHYILRTNYAQFYGNGAACSSLKLK